VQLEDALSEGSSLLQRGPHLHTTVHTFIIFTTSLTTQQIASAMATSVAPLPEEDTGQLREVVQSIIADTQIKVVSQELNDPQSRHVVPDASSRLLPKWSRKRRTKCCIAYYQLF